MFTKENPLIEKHIDGFQLLSLNGQSYPNPLIENAQIALNLNHHSHIMNDETWTAYSFNYGGIVKADAVFFAVKFNNEIVLLENNDQTIIDYTEGMIYLSDFHYSDIRFTGGIFNIKPIKIYKKGDLNLSLELLKNITDLALEKPYMNITIKNGDATKLEQELNDLNKEYTIKEEDLKSKACNTPFLGWKVKGELIMNIVDGQLLVEE